MSPSRPRAPVVGALAVVALLAVAPAVRGQTSDQGELVVLEEEKLRWQAELDALRAEKERLDKPAILLGGATAAELKLAPDSPILDAVRKELESAHGPRRATLQRLSDEAATDRQNALNAWKQAYEAARLAREKKAAALATPASQDEGVWDLGLVGLVAGGSLLVLAALLLGIHVDRVGFRERCRGRGLFWAVFVAVLAGASPAEIDEQRAERERLHREIGALKAEVATAKAEVDAARKRHVERWRALLGVEGEKEDAGAAAAAVVWEGEIYLLLHSALVDARLVELATDAGKALLEKARKDRDQVTTLRSRADRTDLTRHVAKFAVAAGFPLLALLLLRRSLRKAARHERAHSEQCPRCLRSPDKTHPKILVPKSTDPQVLQCQVLECSHEVPIIYRKRARLCFPTVGMRGSGKTHWLLSAYDLVSRNPEVIEKVDSPANAKFDDLVDQVLHGGGDLEGTTFELPSPLAFHLCDSDRNAALLSLFDYGGELVNARHDDKLKQHALRMNGFILFLDPTQRVGRQGQDYQMKVLDDFHRDMRISRKIEEADACIDVPVAVCISKLNLLPNQKYLGGTILEQIERLRATGNQPLTLELLEERSRILVEMFRALFPSRDYPAILKKHFGQRILFFPATPIGLEAENLGLDLKQVRQASPFSVLEPILWLLHQRGYDVLRHPSGGRPARE